MKKGYNSTDIQQQEGQDQARRLYRSISDNARRLDDARGCARLVSELFTPALLSQRSRLRENCEKLIFLDPLLYGRKGEELLWRKVYYDVVSTSKRIKKQDYTTEDIAHLQCHINAGLGYYHHFISRLEIEFDLSLQGIVDFPVNSYNKSIIKQVTASDSKSDNPAEWAEQSVHRCLVYLGDLSRYKVEIYPNWDHGLAIRYYLQASSYKPEYGMPHNQLGTLATGLNYYLDATYHYIRCLDCEHVFEGTENNLLRLFEKNSCLEKSIPNEISDCLPEPNEHIKRLIIRFLSLVDILYFEKKRNNIHSLCHEVLLDLQSCLTYSKPISSESEDSPVDSDSFDVDSLSTPTYLSSDIIFKMIVICLMCIIKLKKIDSPQLSVIKAFLLAMYSQLIQNIIEHIQGSVFNISLPTQEQGKKRNGELINGKKKGIAKLRRRVNDSSEDSDLSESEISFENQSDTDTSVSDNEENSESSAESDTESKNNIINSDIININGTIENNITEVKLKDNEVIDPVKKIRRMDPNDLLEIVADEGLLQSVKILCDWLTGDTAVLKECGSSSQILLKRIIQLLNLINLETSYKKIKNIKVSLEKVRKDFLKIPLPEDVILKGIPVLQTVQKDVDWNTLNKYILDPKEQALFRIHKLLAFGHYLTSVNETGVSFQKKKKCFFVAEIEIKIPELISNENDDGVDQPIQENEPMSRGKLMKHMGQLWLAAEVQNLESRVQNRTPFSPYLVLDIDALINFTHLAKQLVSARKFIILIPIVVLSALDELKRETIKARDAIRWLETQFHRGNRFLRAQRSQERAPIPLIKYPKKKDKDTYTFIQIIECCHFLTQQQKGATNLVTLLTGNQSALSTSEAREISYVGLAQSAGVNMELITVFHSKWKKSMKGNR